nr:hypothetical protein [Tanacetum cinerariifolium]
MVQVLMDLVDDELSLEKNYARNGEWLDITMKKALCVSFYSNHVSLLVSDLSKSMSLPQRLEKLFEEYSVE